MFTDLPKYLRVNKKYNYLEVDKDSLNLSKEDINKFYEKEFYENEKTDYLEGAWGKDYELLKMQWTLRIKKIEEIYQKKDLKILDVGTGPGTFLKVASDLSHDAQGIDLSPAAVSWVNEKGYKSSLCHLGEDDFEEEYFDFIHASEVLEHLYEPELIVKRITEILKPNGMVCFSVPNDFSIVQYYANKIVSIEKKYWWVDIKHHLNYFNQNSLTKLMKNYGLKDIFFMNTFPLDLFLLMGKNYVDNPSLGRDCHLMRQNFEKLFFDTNSIENLIEFYCTLSTNGLGRHIVAFGRK